MHHPRLWLLTALLLLPVRRALADAEKTHLIFGFGPGQEESVLVTHADPTVGYFAVRGYGFENPFAVRLGAGCVTSDKPFYFSVKLPDGNYDVTLLLGADDSESDTTVKAELRRLMLQGVRLKASQFVSRTFTVNVRTPKIAGDGEVHLKSREKTEEVWAWDDKLTLEFNGSRPCLRSIEITKVEVPTAFLLGDSTVCDQPKEPWNGWGQMLTRFFKPGVAVSNQAESGETLRGALHAGRVAKVLGDMKKGDYLFIQFGHNDMKEMGPGVGAFTTYKADMEKLVTDVRQHGGTPVLITSMNRKRFDDSGHVVNTLADYPDAVRAVAKEMNVPVIDLNAVSKKLYEAIGKANIDKAFVDGTHHNAYGSYELARCVIEGICQDKLDLAKYIVDDIPPFDPEHPDPIDTFNVPASRQSSAEKPPGN